MATFTSVITMIYGAMAPSETTSFAVTYERYKNRNTWADLQSGATGTPLFPGNSHWIAEIKTDIQSPVAWDYFYRSAQFWYTNIPPIASVGTVQLALDSGSTSYPLLTGTLGYGTPELVVTAFIPASYGTTTDTDYGSIRSALEVGRISLNSITPSSYFTVEFNDAGVEWVRSHQPNIALGLTIGWESDNSEPAFRTNQSAYIESGDAAPHLDITYTVPRDPGDYTRRRFELPVEPSRFVPMRSSTRYGAPISLQDVRAARVELPSQVQDFANEQPPVIQRNFGLTPNSVITALPGTILVAPEVVERPLWYKLYGSGNTGWEEIQGPGQQFSLAAANPLVLVDTSSSNTTYTLPEAASSVNTVYTIKKSHASNVLDVMASSRSVEGETKVTIVTLYDSATFRSDGTDWWIV